MGFDLTNSKGQEFHFNKYNFPRVLTLAEYFGWEPMGTVLSDDWNGTYVSNDWQHVLEEDAFNLAKALKTAVKALPDESFFSDREIEEGPSRSDGDYDIIFLIKYFSGKEWKNKILHFVSRLQSITMF